MYFETYRAVGDHVEYEKTGDGGWRATFDGAFTVSAKARTPDDALLNLQRQLDKLVAGWIVRPSQAEGRSKRASTRRAGRNFVRGPNDGVQ